MQQRPQLTPEDRRSIRNWSFVVAIVYSTLLLVCLAVISIAYGPAPPDADMAIAVSGQSGFATEASAKTPDRNAENCHPAAAGSLCNRSAELASPP